MYETLIVIDPEDDLSPDRVGAALAALYSKSAAETPAISGSGTSLTLRWPDFVLEIHHSALPHVLEESREIAELAPASHRSRIAACRARLEIGGSDDPGMEFFNDFCHVVGALEELGTVYTFDQGSGEFMNL